MFITDFDGVLCNSVQECLLVTYNAYHGLQSPSHQRIFELDAIPPAIRVQFQQLRPYLKGVEDFIPIYIAIEKNLVVNNQHDFDQLRASYQNDLPTFQKAFHGERDFLQHQAQELWLRLNPLFDGIKEILQQHPAFENMYILTTKRQKDVMEIFQANNIVFPTDHVIYIPATAKSQRLLELLRQNEVGFSQAVYLEDQVDFLIEAQKHQIGSYLVAWGYVSDEQKALARQRQIPIIQTTEFQMLLRRFQQLP
jgi:phosphoglycolate phosphatase-like HAD superfamily hydrolase